MLLHFPFHQIDQTPTKMNDTKLPPPSTTTVEKQEQQQPLQQQQEVMSPPQLNTFGSNGDITVPLLQQLHRPLGMRRAKADAISAISRMKSNMPTITPLPVPNKNNSKGNIKSDDPTTTTTKSNMLMTPTSTAATASHQNNNDDAVFKTPNDIESKLTSSSNSSTKRSSSSSSSSKKKLTPQHFLSPFRHQQNSKSTAVQLAKIPVTKTTNDFLQENVSSSSFANIKNIKVVSYIHVQPTSTFGLRLLSMVHQSHIESPHICRWIDSGKSVEIRSKHPELQSLLLQYFQRTYSITITREKKCHHFSMS